MKLYFQDKSLCLSSNKDLVLYEGDSNFNFKAQRVKIPHFKGLLTSKQARWPHFLLHFYNVHIMNVHYAKFKKSLIVEQFQGNYLKLASLGRETSEGTGR